MATYYLISNDQLINEFDMDDTAVTGLSLSLLGGGETISLTSGQYDSVEFIKKGWLKKYRPPKKREEK